MTPKAVRLALVLSASILWACAAEMSDSGDDSPAIAGEGGVPGGGGASGGRGGSSVAGSGGSAGPGADAGSSPATDTRGAVPDTRAPEPATDARPGDAGGTSAPAAPAIGAPIAVLMIDTMGKSIPSTGKVTGSMKV